MNKERTDGLIFFGDISGEEIKSIPKDFHGDIIVTGDIICYEKCVIPGSLWLSGDYLYAKQLEVEGDLFVKKGAGVEAESGINVSGDFILGEECYIDTASINVGGDFEGQGRIDSTAIDVYGTFAFCGEIKTHGYEIHAGKLEVEATITGCGGIKSGW